MRVPKYGWRTVKGGLEIDNGIVVKHNRISIQHFEIDEKTGLDTKKHRAQNHLNRFKVENFQEWLELNEHQKKALSKLEGLSDLLAVMFCLHTDACPEEMQDKLVEIRNFILENGGTNATA